MFGDLGVDKQELDGCTKQECFVLGFELSQVYTALRIQPSKSFTMPVHAANSSRIRNLVRRSKRTCIFGPATRGWRALHVHGDDCNDEGAE